MTKYQATSAVAEVVQMLEDLGINRVPVSVTGVRFLLFLLRLALVMSPYGKANDAIFLHFPS